MAPPGLQAVYIQLGVVIPFRNQDCKPDDENLNEEDDEVNEDGHQKYDRISAAGAALLFTFFPAINWLQAFQANRPAVQSENLSVRNQNNCFQFLQG